MKILKLYIAEKKKGDTFQYGMTIYSETGKVLASNTKHEPVLPNKFENVIDLFLWVTQKIKTYAQNKTISEDEAISLFMSSKTVYTWFEKELAPEPYLVKFSDLLLEMAFLLNPTEIIYSKTADKRVLFKNLHEDKVEKVTDLFS